MGGASRRSLETVQHLCGLLTLWENSDPHLRIMLLGVPVTAEWNDTGRGWLSTRDPVDPPKSLWLW